MATKPETFQTVYYVNCPTCGDITKVVNPRLDKEPYRITQSDANERASTVITQEKTRIVCSSCKNGFYVLFSYI